MRSLHSRMEYQSVSAQVLNFSTILMVGGRLHVQATVPREILPGIPFDEMLAVLQRRSGLCDVSRCSCGDSIEELHRLFCRLPWKSEISDNLSYRSWKKQFVITHTIRQTEIPALLDSSVTNTHSVKMLCKQTSCLSVCFRKIILWLSFGLLRIGQVFCASCKFIYLWVMTICWPVTCIWI